MPSLMRRALTAPYAPETKALLSAMSVPASGARARLIDKTIRGLKNNGLWTLADVIYFPAAHDSQAACLNWKGNSSFNLVAVNSPTFTANSGYAGNASTSYLNTNWIPSTNGVKYTQADASFGAYLTNAGSSNSGTFDMGCDDGTTKVMLNMWGAGNGLRFRFNTNSGSSIEVGTVSTRRGLSLIDITGDFVTGYRNGASLGSSGQADTGLTATYPVWLGGINVSGTLTFPSADNFAFVWAGATMTAAQHAALNVVVQNYITGVGA